MFLLNSCLFLSVALFSLRLNVLDSRLLLLFRQIMFGIGKWRNSLYLSALDVNNSTKSYNLDCCANGVSFYSFIATLRNTDGLDEVHSYSERWQICLCLYIIYIIYISLIFGMIWGLYRARNRKTVRVKWLGEAGWRGRVSRNHPRTLLRLIKHIYNI